MVTPRTSQLRTLLLWITLSAIATLCVAHGRREACIVGGGRGGVSAATTLMKRGYKDILLLERMADRAADSGIGGHCDVFYGPGGSRISAGVATFPDTAWANQVLGRRWNVNMKAQVKRYLGPNSIGIPSYFEAMPFFAVDYARSLFLGPATFTPTPEYLADYARFFDLMNTTFLWMETLDEVPNPIPAELLLPMNEWIAYRNFSTIYSSFLGALFYGGFGDFNTLKAFDGLMQRTPTNLLYGTAPGAWFSPVPDCQAWFNEVARSLNEEAGKEIVWTNTTIHHIRRPRNPHSSAPSIISGIRDGKHFIEVCDRVIIAIPQILSDLEAIMDLTEAETEAFENVTANSGFWIGIYDVTVGPNSPIASGNGTFALTNADSVLGLPAFPAGLVTFRREQQGPAAFYMFSENPPLSQAEATASIQTALAGFVQAGIFSSANVTLVYRHRYKVSWPEVNYRGPIAPHNRVESIQGQTLWVGALMSTHNSMVIEHRTRRLMRKHFPSKAVERRSEGLDDEDLDDNANGATGVPLTFDQLFAACKTPPADGAAGACPLGNPYRL